MSLRSLPWKRPSQRHLRAWQMRILFDECVPVALKRHRFPLGHERQTVREAGFAGKKHGAVLTLAERRWDVLPTTDRKIQYHKA